MEKNYLPKFCSRIFRLFLPYALVLIYSVHVSIFLDASNLDVWKKLSERGYAAVF